MLKSPETIFLFFQDGNSSTFGCVAILVIALVIIIAVSIQKMLTQNELQKKLISAKNDYFRSIKALKSDPTNADLRQTTLSLGRKYSEVTRQIQNGNKSVTIYDEMALMNDINAACAAAYSQVPMQTKPYVEPIEERLNKLNKLKDSNLIDDQEYQERRRKILDEI